MVREFSRESFQGRNFSEFFKENQAFEKKDMKNTISRVLEESSIYIFFFFNLISFLRFLLLLLHYFLVFFVLALFIIVLFFLFVEP